MKLCLTCSFSLAQKDDRLEILKALSSRLQLDEDVRLDDIVAQSEHFTGADLQAVLYTAQLKAVTQLTLTGKTDIISLTSLLFP